MIKKTAATLEAKLCILMIGTLFVVLIGLGHLAMSEFRATITRQKMEEFNSIARSLAPYSKSLVNKTDSHFNNNISSFVKNSKMEIVYIVVADEKGRTLFLQSKNLTKDSYPDGLRWWLVVRRLLGYEAINPDKVQSVSLPVSLDGGETGLFTVGFSLAGLNRMIDAVQAKALFGLALGFMVGIALAVAMGRNMTRSLKSLIKGARAVSAGDFDVYVQPRTGDCIAELSREFNTMVDNLATSHETLTEHANTDSLTGLYNHRYFQDCLALEMSRASRYNHGLSLLMIDIDFFKNFNDEQGHPAGDAALKDVASSILRGIRQCDIAIRYGGEEFAVILPQTHEHDAVIIAERVRKIVEHHNFKAKDGSALGLTVSIGVAECPPGCEDQMSLLLASDIALYQAKSLGRNRVCSYSVDSPCLPQGARCNTYVLFGANDMLTIEALAGAVDAKLKLPEGHSQSVAQLAAATAQNMGMSEMSKRAVYLAALLRDIGQIVTPDTILSKPDELTPEEMAMVANHPNLGHSIVQKAPNLSTLLPAILHHHEHYDGTGYPLSASGEDIPLPARIISAADAYQSMITSRPYRDEMTPEEAKKELLSKSSTQFDPKVVQAVIDILAIEEQERRAA